MRASVVVLGLVVGCTTPHPTPAVTLPTSTVAPPTATTASAPITPGLGAPLVINDRVVDPATGVTLTKVAGVSQYDTAVPRRDGTNRFLIGARIVDGSTGATAGWLGGAVLTSGKLERVEPSGGTRWSVPLPGARSVRPPDVVVAGGVTVAVVDDALHAFDDATGKALWTAPGPADRLTTDGTLVFTTSCNSGRVPGRAVIARRAADGKEAWRALVAEESDPDAIELDPRHVIVRDTSRNVTFVFDHAGKELHRIKESVQVVHPIGQDLLVFTDKHVARYEDAGRVAWTIPALAATFVAGNDVVDAGAFTLVGNYGRISDSGVDLVALDPTSGVTRWRTKVPGLGVGHSEYLHVAYLELRGPKVYVVSQGSGGSFFERVDVATGKRELRCDVASARCAPP